MLYYYKGKEYEYKRAFRKAYETYLQGIENNEIYSVFGAASCLNFGKGIQINRSKADSLIVDLIGELEKIYTNDGLASFLLALIHDSNYSVSKIKKVDHYLKHAISLGNEDALAYYASKNNDTTTLIPLADKGNYYAITKLMDNYHYKFSNTQDIIDLGNIAFKYHYLNDVLYLFNHNVQLSKEEKLNMIEKLKKDYNDYCDFSYPNNIFEVSKNKVVRTSNYWEACVNIPSFDGTNTYGSQILYGDVLKANLADNILYLDKKFASQCNNLIEVKLPSSLKVIGEEAFKQCYNLTNISLPDSLERIDKEAFSMCELLLNIVIPHNVTYIGEEAFSKCHLTYLSLPSSLKTIDVRAFEYNDIEYLFIPNSVVNLFFRAFTHNEKLIKVDFENDSTLDTLEENVFSYCTSLEEINLPSSLKVIKEDALSYCTSLKSILIPVGVKNIASDAFKGTNLDVVYAYEDNYDYVKDYFSYDDNIIVCKLKDKEKSLDENIESSTSFDLDLNWENAFASDERATSTYIASVSEALLSSLSTLGRVDIEYISQVTGVSLKEVIDKLGSSIYQDPLAWEECFYKGFKTSDDYLSGNLLIKLRIAEKYNRVYHGYFQKNVDALKALLPDAIKLDKIYFTIASNFIPTSLIKEFLNTVAGVGYENKFDLSINEITGKYEIEVNGFGFYVSNFARTYSTARINAKELIEHALNSQPVVIYDHYLDYNKKHKSTLNKSETIFAEQKVKQLNQDFISWVNEDEARSKIVQDAYNEKYGYNVTRIYDGSFLSFVGLSSSVNLFSYQKNAVARIIFNRNTLLAHNVGTGKTYIMIASGEELINMNKSKKNMYVVPNHILPQWEEAYHKLYPNSRIKVVTPYYFNPSNMYETLLDIKNGEYRAIIIPYSCFDRIEISKTKKIEKLQEELDAINHYMKKNPNKNTFRPRKIKLEKEIEDLRLSKAAFLGFDELGITRLYVDEAHNYKNIPIETSLERIKGISLSNSKKCVSMLEKVDYMNALPGGGVIMATGTPITNSVTDVYTFQIYLQKAELSLLSIKSFDNWVAMFCEKHEEFEVDVDAVGFRMSTRLSRFHNLPELTSLLAGVADFYSSKEEGVPDFKGYKDIVLEKTPALSDYLLELSNRCDAIRNKDVKRKDDNLLLVTNDGRKAALDLRLVKENYNSVNDITKAYECAKNAYYIYNATMKDKSTQVIFCDISTPKDGFNVYDEIRKHLILFGVDPSHIAFVHDYDSDTMRRKLFKAMNSGEIRILLGSTFKLGTGVNIQQKLIALHHIDVPWRPADMVQREGRIIRPGNENKEVYIYRYIAKGSFDAYSWQLLETKQSFISELLSNSLSLRSKEDVADTVLDYAEVKALAVSNPKLKERFEVANELNRLKILDKKQKETKVRNQIALLELPTLINEYQELMLLYERDIICYKQDKVELSQEEKVNFRKSLLEALNNNELAKEEKEIAIYQGFKVILPINMMLSNKFIYLERNTRHKVSMSDSEIGNLLRIDNYLENMSKLVDEKSEQIRDLENRITAINEENRSMVDLDEKLSSLTAKLMRIEGELNNG